MDKIFDVVALGELLIDFTPAGISSSGMRLFEQNPGGAPANVLCTLSKFGVSTSFVGKVGKDIHGEFLKQTLVNNGVDISNLVFDEDSFTTLAFVELAKNGQRDFSFSRKPGADTRLRTDDINMDLLKNCKIFHFGSLSLTNEPARTATLTAVKSAKDANAIISYDPNFREPLWESKDAAKERIRSVLPLVDIIKISNEEMELVTGQKTLEAAAESLLCFGISCIVITLGAKGAYAKTKFNSVQITAPSIKVTDSTGAGDVFWGSFLFGILNKKLSLDSITKDELSDCIEFSNSAASLCVKKQGAIPSIPTMAEVFEFMKSKKEGA